MEDNILRVRRPTAGAVWWQLTNWTLVPDAVHEELQSLLCTKLLIIVPLVLDLRSGEACKEHE